MRIVIALGGNALLERGEHPEASVELSRLQMAAKVLAPLIAEHEVIISHGNGPQVGVLAAESSADLTLTHPYPLDGLVAQTQGMIGYWLAQLLRNAGVDKPIVALVTQTVVDPADPAFLRPSTSVGPVYSASRAQHLAAKHGWTVAADGPRWRRVVPSPEPQAIVELASITDLLDDGAVVICGGGGGSAVTEDAAGKLTGAEAVIDKDSLASLLGIAVGADRLLILTDVSGVMAHFGTPQAELIPYLDAGDADILQLPGGSMRPKVEACRRFVVGTGGVAAIGALADAREILDGSAGTTIAMARR